MADEQLRAPAGVPPGLANPTEAPPSFGGLTDELDDANNPEPEEVEAMPPGMPKYTPLVPDGVDLEDVPHLSAPSSADVGTGKSGQWALRQALRCHLADSSEHDVLSMCLE